MTYTVKEDIKPSGLNGISDEQIADHWNLYVGYINQANALKQDLEAMRLEGKSSSLGYADRRRRFGFEFAGMTLHEFYFANLKANVELSENSKFAEAVKKTFGSFEAWKDDFVNTGKSRSIGWAICYMDPETGDINNHFVQLHEEGNIPSFHPIVVMDVWEHAYMVDHKAGGRPDYIGHVMSNINWDVVEQRLADAESKLASSRA
jgi:Fe-Mn family superoxide dismutase